MSVNEIVFNNVKDICAKKKITVTELERTARIGNGTIGKWKNSVPQLDTLVKVAEILNVPLSRLLKKTKRRTL